MAEMPDYNLTNSSDKQAFQRFMVELMRNEINSYTKQTQNSNPNPSASLATGLLPSGVIVPFAGGPGVTPNPGTLQDVPDGWLLCAGSAVSRNSYSALFAAVGTTYGVGDGSTTFNVPDLNGRVPVGKGANAAVSALNTSDGSVDASRNPNHTHSITHTHDMGNHTHPAGGLQALWIAGGGIMYWQQGSSVNWNSNLYAGVGGNVGGGGNFNNGISVGGSTSGPSTNTTDGSNTANTGTNVQPFIVLNYIIKT